MTVANTQAAVNLLSRALFGITETGQMEPAYDADEPTLSVSEIEEEGDGVRAKVRLP